MPSNNHRNLQLQHKELKLLTELLGTDAWRYSTPLKNVFRFVVTDNVEILITLNEHYPLESPPLYDLFAPTLTGEQRDTIRRQFQAIYDTNQGDPIIHAWLQKLKEVAENNRSRKWKGNKKQAVSSKHRRIPDKDQHETLEIFHGEPITDRKSTFQAHVCAISDISDIKTFRNKLLQHRKIASAKHNVVAYRLDSKKGLLEDCDDDGENLAGPNLLNTIRKLGVTNVCVIVTRWFGGTLLGHDRFRLYNFSAKQALDSAGFIS